MLVYARQCHVVLLQQGKNVVHLFWIDTELGFLARSDDLGVMPCANAGVEANHDLAALVDTAEIVQLRDGVHADEQPVLEGIL